VTPFVRKSVVHDHSFPISVCRLNNFNNLIINVTAFVGKSVLPDHSSLASIYRLRFSMKLLHFLSPTFRAERFETSP